MIKGTVTDIRDGISVERESFADLTIVGDLAKVEVVPDIAEVRAGGYIGFKARVLDSLGQEIPGLHVTWRVADETVGTIDGLGVLKAGSVVGDYEDAILATAEQQVLIGD